MVSTHSRLKAADDKCEFIKCAHGFNTQPPEGGCVTNIQAGEIVNVSTHSRLKAADLLIPQLLALHGFNTQPPEGGWHTEVNFIPLEMVSTHSRLKAAGRQKYRHRNPLRVSTHSRLKAADQKKSDETMNMKFQHTAA